jgi:small multidrug resistance pump
MLPYYLALSCGILFGIFGQIALKTGTNGAATIVDQFLHPWTMVGLVFYGLAAVLYIVAIKKIPLSLAYPSIAVSYFVVSLAGHLLWNEPFGLPQMGGLVLIAGGVVLLFQ